MRRIKTNAPKSKDQAAEIPPAPATPIDLEMVLQFLPIFEDPEFRCGEMIEEEGKFPHAEYHETTRSFFYAWYLAGLVVEVNKKTFKAWDKKANDMARHPELIDQASLEDLRIYFAMIMAIDGMTPGMFFMEFEKGHIIRMLRRLKAISGDPQ